MSKAPTQLLNFKHNVHESCGERVTRVQGDIDRKIFDYFFLHVIAHEHGSRQCIVNFFFQRLYEECQNQKIPAVWDEENGTKLLSILNNLNFDGKTSRRTKPARP